MEYNIDKQLLDGVNVVDFRVFDGEKKPVVYFDPQSEPVEISCLPFHDRNRGLCRLPEDHLRDQAVNKGVWCGGGHRLPGVAIRFRTNSTLIGLRAVLGHNIVHENMPREAGYAFTFYEGTAGQMEKKFQVMPQNDEDTFFEGWIGKPGTGQWKEWTVYCPLYGEVHYLRLILTHDADIASPTPFTYPKPIVFYGSSVTNGIGASDSSMDYPSQISRALDTAVVNLGFNGSCKGEPFMARCIADIPEMSMFVMGYDNNAPSPEELLERHEPFYRIVRAARPNLPIIFFSRPNTPHNEDGRKRAAIVKRTYDRAVAAGDKLVWFVDGMDTMPDNDVNRFTVDGCHPNDEGYGYIAKKLIPTIREVLER